MRAWWLVLGWVVACGDNRGLALDAGVTDGPLGLVTLRYYPDDFSSARGLAVYFQNPDSSLILATETFADGSANAFMPSGGFVTLRDANGELWTWGGVKPGDELVLGRPQPISGGLDVNVNVPFDADANTYWMHTSCGEVVDVTGAQLELRVFNITDCDRDVLDLLVVTRKVNFTSLSSFSLRRDVNVRLSRTLLFDAPLVPASPSLITLRNVPSRFGYFYARQELRGRDGGVLFDSGSFGTALIQNLQGMAMTVVEVPRPAEATLVTYVDDVNTNGASSTLHLVEWGPASQPVEIDVQQRMVRSLIGEPMYVPTSGTVRWPEGGDGLIAEAALVDLVFGVGRLRWHVLAPRGVPELIGEGSIRLPILPDPDLVPADDEPMRALELRSILTSDGYGGYRTTLLGRSSNEVWPLVGTAGHVSWSEMRQ